MVLIRSSLCLLLLCVSLFVLPSSFGAKPSRAVALTAPQGHGSPPAAGSVLYLPSVMSGQPASGWVIVASEDFEDPDSAWQFLDRNGATNGEYRWARRTCRPYAGSYSGWAVGDGTDGAALACGASYPDNAQSWMVYGPFSLADAAAAQLEFEAWFNGVSSDELCYGASSDDLNYSAICLTAQTGGWTSLALDLGSQEAGSQLGKPQVWVALVFLSDGSDHAAEGAYVDDVIVRKRVGGGCASSEVGRKPRSELAGPELAR